MTEILAQDYLLEARQMQALSFVVHIPLVCIGIAFPALVLFVEWRYLRTGDELYRTLARRWSKVLVALFAAGVVTGTILSFELGLLWPNFTATFGGVFGLGFAIEGFSFFLEAIFIGIYVYGWNRLSPRAHFLSGLPIAVAGVIGSFMVISVNGWMNHPGHFTFENGRVVSSNSAKALFANSFFWHEFVHMYVAGFIVTGFLVAGAYAVYALRGKWGRYERTAFTVPMTAAAVASPVQILIGDWAAREVAKNQPIKLAAMEGLGQTTKGAALHILGWYQNGEVIWGLGIPKLLSLLAFHNINATVQGLDTVPLEDQPPVNVVRYSFQSMVFAGTFLALVAVVFLFYRWWRHRLPVTPWFYRAVVLCAPLSIVALLAGWITTEVGRQPWVVYGYMRTEEAVTGASGVPVGYGVLAAVYLALVIAVIWILVRLARSPMPSTPEDTDALYPLSRTE
ncbi:cytochrome bd-I ubiquinol oxidase subunit 1 apoprotein [Asanoa ferruginea]|uniref:Cytochrome bd-I ubiquinol oxidase subunit 1 apoprotein n=1 Tax=Asanoa ferruginea TaxID=53367 RepID=A0A3D9ZKL2_9ACTN|nr:cytochrome ubiquinol oxidase subunit I [Asanoa ferruginea]REF97399.1 cytochrome bd-I ubiquinol oxidase subunit 1 apoprotein [Asanoa ferruginea]GIF48317.1 cytochrome ubiquinol oxidase subunit I [Asanoa ferruginea]